MKQKYAALEGEKKALEKRLIKMEQAKTKLERELAVAQVAPKLDGTALGKCRYIYTPKYQLISHYFIFHIYEFLRFFWYCI